MLALSALCLFAGLFYSGLTAGEKNVRVAMILWRGETPAEKGFMDELNKEKGLRFDFTAFNADQDNDKLKKIIAGLDSSRYDLIYTFGTTVTKAVMTKVKDRPVIFNIVARPVETGIIKSREDSGNNLTGASNTVPMDSAFKTMSLVIHIRKLGFIYNREEINSEVQKQEIEKLQRKYGFVLFGIPMTGHEDVPNALLRVLDLKADTVMFPADSLVKANADRLISFLNKNKIPTIAPMPEMVEENKALLALGPDYYQLGVLAAHNALEVLNGKKPSEVSTKTVHNLEITYNEETAHRLGISFPLQMIKGNSFKAGRAEKSMAAKMLSVPDAGEILAVIRAVIPSFAIAFVGFMLGRVDPNLHQKTISNLIYYVFSPCLIFSSLHKRAFDLGEFGILSVAVILLIAGMMPVAYLFKRRAKIRENGYYLPVIFMSTGTISLPIALLMFGNEGLAKGILFHMANILFLYSFGVFLVSGRADLKQFLKIPALYATIAGILVANTSFEAPVYMREFVWLFEKGVDLIGLGAIPLLILSFGYSLNNTSLSSMRQGIGGGMAKVIAGPVLAFLIVYLFRQSGMVSVEKGYDLLKYLDLRTTEAIVILNAAMPGPIMAYMLNVKFDNCPDKAAAMLSVGTIGGIVTVPIALHLINVFIFG